MVKVDVRKDKDLILMKIHDNGKSFEVERVLRARRIARLGLIGMRERVVMVGGSFEIDSEPGKGTTIRAQIPIKSSGKSRRAPAPRRGQ